VLLAYEWPDHIECLNSVNYIDSAISRIFIVSARCIVSIMWFVVCQRYK